MESGIVGTNGKLVWELTPGRWAMEGQTVGRKIITTIQNFRGSRCQSCKLILFDYGSEV